MNSKVTRRKFLSAIAAFAASSQAAAAAPPAQSLRPMMRGDGFYKRAVRTPKQIIAAEKLSGRLSFAVADAKTGKWLECENEQIGTPPASVTKAITALYALDTLGENHRFETRLMATGSVKDGQVQGDLVLVGGGDPTLDTNGLAELAARLKAAGVIGVNGEFVVFEGQLPLIERIDPAQPDQVGYNPAVSGLALNFNRVHFEWKRAAGAYDVTMDARSEKYRPEVHMARMRVADRAAPVYTYENKGSYDSWTVARGALGKGGSRWLPVRKPGLYAGEVFATLAGAHGIRLRKPQIIKTLPEGEVLAALQSAPLREIARDMLKYSTNLTAEMIGLTASKSRVGQVTDLKTSAAEMNQWAQDTLRMRHPALVDHSGLGDASALTAQDMVGALIKVRDAGLRPILKPFVMRDKKGQPIEDHPIVVDAKTGTLNFVSGLAGYLTSPDGIEMAFAIFAADHNLRDKIGPGDRERPAGGRTWNRKAKRVQQALIERWGVIYGT